ncbi:MAG: YceI family protein [Anaeromyxobacteraceae bacterium]
MIPLAAALLLATAPAAARALAVQPGASSVSYQIIHKLHEVEARATRLEGKAVVQPDGKVLAMVRVPVASFDSGDANRDAHMQEATEAGRFPFAVVKGIAALPVGALDGGRPSTLATTLAGELDFHGVKRPLSVPLTVSLDAGGVVRVRGAFMVSLDAHDVERPSLLFVKVDDACKITLDLTLAEVRP